MHLRFLTCTYYGSCQAWAADTLGTNPVMKTDLWTTRYSFMYGINQLNHDFTRNFMLSPQCNLIALGVNGPLVASPLDYTH